MFVIENTMPTYTTEETKCGKHENKCIVFFNFGARTSLKSMARIIGIGIVITIRIRLYTTVFINTGYSRSSVKR